MFISLPRDKNRHRNKLILRRRAEHSKRRRVRLVLESLEERRVLSNDGFLQGYAFVDVNSDNKLDSGDVRKVNSQIELRSADGSMLITALSSPNPAITDADGYYRFDGLAPGTYQIKEIAPPGFASVGTQISTSLSSASQVNASTIQVTLADPTNLPGVRVQKQVAIPGANSTYTLAGAPFNAFTVIPDPFNAHQFEFKLSLDNGATYGSSFYTFCVDLYHANPGTFAVNTGIVPVGLGSPVTTNLGRIGYLYNEFGTKLLPAAQATGLQLAMYELLYDNVPNFSNGNFVLITSTTDAAAVTAANSFLSQSAGKDQRAIFLNVPLSVPGGTSGTQSQLTTELFNFSNNIVPLASLGDRLWLDTNGDGKQDANTTLEPGLVGYTVTLIGGGADGLINGVGDTNVTTTTGANGLYQFSSLIPGIQYQVLFGDKPSGTVFTVPDVSGNSQDALDSDVNPLTGKTQIVTLAPGENNVTLDAGVYAPAALGDFVWDDLNANGQQDPLEPGISGVVVNLLKDNVLTGQTTTTDGSGAYAFTGLVPGSYSVQFVTPAGYVATVANTGNDASDSDSVLGVSGAYTLISGQTDNTIDAGFYKLAALGDFVWDDLNANGQQDPLEPGISGVVVNLLKDNVLTGQTTTTDGSGAYAFTGLVPGSYSVQFVTPAGYVATVANTGNDASDSDSVLGVSGAYTLISGQTDNTIDAGFYKLAALGDFVWDDLNANGQQDPLEPGISGVVVNLLKDNVLTGQTTTTDGSGAYAFTGLVPGSYSVQFVTPAGYVATVANTGNDASDSDSVLGVSGAYTLISGQTDNTIDAGFYKLAALGDFVWDDLNANGQQDPLEPGISGVVVNLLKDNVLTGQTTTTDGSGAYAFTGLVPGSYSVQFVTPAGYVATVANTGNDASDSDSVLGVSGAYTLISGQTDNTIDAGFYKLAALGDFVWDDLNANGQQDPLEPGISGVVVNLLKDNVLTGQTTTTDGSGAYAFTGLVPGSYSVQFVTPAGYVATVANTGNDASDSDSVLGVSGAYTLISGQTDNTIDAGFYKLAALGDFVWDDLNANGQQDPLEPGISGVVVNLLKDNVLTGQTTTTNGSGAYAFTGLVPGSYSVQFVTPAGYVATVANTGNDASDSDSVLGVSGAYTLISGQTDNTIDAGFYKLAALGDFVWDDLNANGQQDPLEPGISGVVVNLLKDNVLTGQTTTTNGSGAYAFTGLVPGSYSVQFVTPAGYVATVANTGNDASDSDSVLGLSGAYTLISGQTDNTIDAGFYKLAALGDFVWDDLNANGQQDPLEPGISGVVVNLLKDNVLTGQTTTTDGSGLMHSPDWYRAVTASSL